MVSALDSSITGNTYADADISALFSDEAEIEAYICFEKVLAEKQGELGIIPESAAVSISQQLTAININPDSLADSFAKDGTAIPGLITTLRAELSADLASHLHHGVTSQDVIDTGLVIRLRSVCELLQSRLVHLNKQLRSLAYEHRSTLTIARTRNQNAAPAVFGLKVVNWLEPLQRQQQRLSALLPRLLSLQLGGSVGTMSALGPKAMELRDNMAKELGLGVSDSPWHVQRDNIAEFGNWLATTAGLIASIGQDMLLLSQSAVGELRFKNGGNSSTLPNKNNPVAPELLVAISTHCQSLSNSLDNTLVANNERDGVGMALETLSLPPLVCATGASLSLADKALESLIVDVDAMQRNIDLDNGRMLAETATFELSRSMARTEASALVAMACAASIANSRNMIDELQQLVTADVDWESLKNPANALGAAKQIIEKAVSR